MRKNVASQVVAFQMIATANGSPVTTGTPTVYYTVDGGTQGTGGGTATHEGQGQWSYVPAQAETNGNHVAFTMVLTNAINQTVNIWPVAFDPTDSVRMGQTALPNAAADAAGGLPISDAGGLDLDSKLANTNEITAARMGALTDWINGGRLDLILDIIAADVVNLDGAAMRGTDSAALASVCTEARLAELDAANLPADNAAIAAAIAALNNLSAATVNAEVDTALADFFTSAAALVSLFWSDTLTAYTDGMAGKRLKSITAVPVDEGTVNDASATTTSFISTLTGRADGHYDDALCVVEIATDQWQGRPVLSYNGTTGEFIFEEGFTSAPINGSAIAVQASHIHPVTQIADGMLDRDMSAGTDSGSTTIRTIRQSLRPLRNKVAIIGGTMTVYKEDDSTASHTAAVTTAAGDPIDSIDPAG